MCTAARGPGIIWHARIVKQKLEVLCLERQVDAIRKIAAAKMVQFYLCIKEKSEGGHCRSYLYSLCQRRKKGCHEFKASMGYRVRQPQMMKSQVREGEKRRGLKEE